MKTHRLTRFAAALTTAIIGASLGTACAPLDLAGFDASQPELTAFNSCGELQNYLQVQSYTKSLYMQNAARLGTNYDPMGYTNGFADVGAFDANTGAPTFNDPSSTARVPFSETNIQEEGVDEADIFKVDATHAFALHDTKLVIIGAVGTPRPDFSPGSPGGTLQIEGAELASTLDLPGQPFEMFLAGNRVVVITRTTHGEYKGTLAEKAPNRADSVPLIKAVVVDVTDRGAPFVEREVAFEGQYISSRRIDNHVYMVARSPHSGPDFSSTLSTDPRWLIERELGLRSASVTEWMPYTYNTRFVDGAAETDVKTADCTATYSSRATNGDQAIGVYHFDLDQPAGELDSTTILGDGAIVYGSQDSIVVAQTNWAQLQYGDDIENQDQPDLFQDFDPFDGSGFDLDITGNGGGSSTSSVDETTPAGPKTELTYLHRFGISDDGSVRYHATGSVTGWILNQFSISEYQGYVRVATQVGQNGETQLRSQVHVLQPKSRAGLLSAPAGSQSEVLDNVASIDDIGVTEELFATRFVGNKGYLVTFRETDPLWVVDLRDPLSPEVRGELMVPGYSTYLHPIDQDHLLAVGEGVDIFGDRDGIKISLFDVSDPDNPRDVEERYYGGSSAESEAVDEHRAFRWIGDQNMMLIPMQLMSEQGMFAWSVDRDRGFTELPTVRHDDLAETGSSAAKVRRAYRIGDYLYTYSAAGVVISSLETLSRVAEVDLPDAP